jgi:YVTN family beta-propeller protein
MQSVATLATPKFAFRLRFTPDGKRVLATIPESGAVLVFDAETHKESGHIAVDGTPLSVAVSVDGRLAYVVAGGVDRVVKIDLGNLKITRSFPPARVRTAWRSRAKASDAYVRSGASSEST